MARPSNTHLRRQEISSALVRVMASHGYHGASIARIAREAGLASGLVLYHFESKEAILLHAVDTLVSAFDDRYRQRLESAGEDPLAQIDAFIDAHLSLGQGADADAVAAWVVVGAQAVQNEEVRRAYSHSVETRLAELDQLVRALRRQHGQSTRGSRELAAALLSAIEGSFLLSSAAGDVLPKGYAAPALRRMVRSLL